MLLAAGRREAILSAIEAHNRANRATLLPRQAGRLLIVMFSDRDECSRSLEDLVGEGFGRNILPKLLRSLVEAGLLSKQRGSARIPNAYRLRLPSEVEA
jgi:hypothetical protein